MATLIGLALTVLILALPSFVPRFPASLATPGAWVALGGMFLLTLAGSMLGLIPLGIAVRRFVVAFVAVFALAALAQTVSAWNPVKTLGLESVFFSVLFGLLIRNTVGLPRWLEPAVRSEYYIKIGLVLLGTSVLFGEIMKAGFFGIAQSVVVVFSVWYFTFWLASRMKLDKEMGVMLASAVSICGVSAAIATCGAIKGDSRKLSFVVSLVLVVAVPMMYLMPWLARSLGLSQEVAGAWMGGTIDTTGAVVASGKFLGDVAETYSVIEVLAERAARRGGFRHIDLLVAQGDQSGRAAYRVRAVGPFPEVRDRIRADLASVQFLSGAGARQRAGRFGQGRARGAVLRRFRLHRAGDRFQDSAGPREPSERFDFPDSPELQYRRDACHGSVAFRLAGRVARGTEIAIRNRGVCPGFLLLE